MPIRQKWQLPPEERRLSGALKEPHLWALLPSDYPSWAPWVSHFLIPDSRKCEVDLWRSSVCNDSSFGAWHLLMQSHPAAGDREQEVILLICGRISTQGVSFWEGNRWLLLPQISSGKRDSWDDSRFGQREVHHLAELGLCVCVFTCILLYHWGKAEIRSANSLLSMIKSGSALITYLKILYLCSQWQSCNGSMLIRPKWTWRRTL